MSVINESADVRFKICEYASGVPYLCTLENGAPSNTILHDRLSLSFQLKDGTSFAEARGIAAYLNQHITMVAVTSY